MEIITPQNEALIGLILNNLENGRQLTNFQLIHLAREQAQPKWTDENDPHFIHELLEIALNRLILKRYNQKFWKTGSELKILEELQELTGQCPPQSWRSENQINLQQFSTPPAVAFLMARILDPQKNDLILEPSAGTGSLAVWLKIAGCRFHLNELAERRRQLLTYLDFTATSENAEFINDLIDIEPDGVLMNPPFSSAGGRLKQKNSNFGFRHLRAALATLKPDGKFVALFNTESLVGSAAGKNFLHELSREQTLKAVIHLPSKTYYKYGTNIGVSIICLKKSKPEKSNRSLPEFVCSELSEVLNLTDILG